jgi:hypothetical protein
MITFRPKLEYAAFINFMLKHVPSACNSAIALATRNGFWLIDVCRVELATIHRGRSSCGSVQGS